ncbi:MAG: hypothetical protein HQ592_18730 [Planctomycetes bacterium]|nr:hypothetical protein [Planctomycetota bacterium]
MMTDLDNRQWPQRYKRDPERERKSITSRRAPARQTSFVSRGFMLCKELGFHGVRRPIPADESRITALAVASRDRVFGTTSGERPHVFLYCSDPSEGIVLDLGVVDGAAYLGRSIVAWDRHTVFVGTSPAPGRVVKCSALRSRNDCVQEWGHRPGVFEDVAVPLPDEGIACLAGDPGFGRLYGLSDRTGTFFHVDVESGEVSLSETVDELQHFSRTLLVTRTGDVYGAGAHGRLFSYSPHYVTGPEEIDAILPSVPGRSMYARVDSWAEHPATGIIYGGTEADGMLFAFDPTTREMHPLGKPTSASRIPAITVGKDGIVYGFSGEDSSIGQMFAYDPQGGTLENLGIPLATAEIRRYGYEFAAAAAGADGEIYLGENDRGGCLFVYFPPTPPTATGDTG